jgi:MtfA peptidase
MGEQGVLNHYGAQDPAEFFAVATEAFFEQGRALRDEQAALYAELQGYFKVDPASW